MPDRHHTEHGEPQMSDAEIERVAQRVFQMIKSEIGTGAIDALKWAFKLAVLAALTSLGFLSAHHASAAAFHFNR